MQHRLGFCLHKQNTHRYLQEGLTWQSEQQQKERIEAFQVVFCLPKSTSYIHIHVHIPPSHTYWAVRIASRVPRGCQNRSAKSFLTSQALPKALCNFCSGFHPPNEYLPNVRKPHLGIQRRSSREIWKFTVTKTAEQIGGTTKPTLPHWRCI